MVAGVCQPISCAVPATAGTNTTTVNQASGTITCNRTGYSGGPASYTCANGVFAVTANACTNSCAVPASAGTNTATVNQASGTITCDRTGYSGGPASYTCANGVFTVTANACLGTKCTCTNCTTDKTTFPGEIIHKFTAVGSASLNCDQAVTVKVLVVGGGGGGGVIGAGGGGGGGVAYDSSYAISAANYPVSYIVSVGGGGVGGVNGTSNPTAGGNSQFNNIVAYGGAGAAGGLIGGSGAGFRRQFVGVGGSPTCGSINGTESNCASIGTTSFYGNKGGDNPNAACWAGGGGGGAGAAGGNCSGTGASSSDPGDGGAGIQITAIDSGFYGGGGGGGHRSDSTINTNRALGGIGGGGYGSYEQNASTFFAAEAGYINTGGGGGGASSSVISGGAGGSGIVIVRYTN
jgi:hypothetical protein